MAANLLARLWRPGHGMDHDDDGAGRRLPGLLRDQAETARMLLHVLQYTDDRRFSPALEDLLEVLVARHVAPTGELADRDESGAEALLRAALYTGRSSFADLARRALEVHSQDFRRYGYAMAAYGRAVELVLRPPLHVVVVGDREDARSQALFRAASETWLPSRVVQLLDPSLDSEQLARLEFPARPDPVAYVCLAHDCAAEHRDPETLWAALVAANTRRVREG